MRIKTTIILDLVDLNIRQLGEFYGLTNEEIKQQISTGEMPLDDIIDVAWQYYEEPCSRVVVEE